MNRLYMVLAGCLLLAVFAAGSLAGWKLRGHEVEKVQSALEMEKGKLAERESAAKAAAGLAAAEKAQVEANAAASVAAANERAAVAERALTRAREVVHNAVQVYVPPAVDDQFPVPVGLVRAHDAAVAAAGGPGDSPCPPAPPAEPPDAPAAVKVSELADTIAYNYDGPCAEAFERVRQWEAYYADLQRAFGKGAMISAPAGAMDSPMDSRGGPADPSH